MGNFNKDKKFGERNFGGSRGKSRGFSGGRDREHREMHKVTCSDCGKNCEVPFRPTGDKPVFCSDCFKNKSSDNSRNFRGGGNKDFSNRRSYQNDGDRNSGNYRVQFEQLNTKLDKILKVLIPDTSEETKKIEVPKSKKIQKAPKKEVDTAALKNVIKKTMDNKLTAKKTTDKKSAAKKSAAKNKKIDKKTAVKKKK